jgi:hypothetical protein
VFSLPISRRGFKETTATEFVMAKTLDNKKSKMQINIMDALLYVLAGGAMLMMSVSFLLWLRF